MKNILKKQPIPEHQQNLKIQLVEARQHGVWPITLIMHFTKLGWITTMPLKPKKNHIKEVIGNSMGKCTKGMGGGGW